MAILLQELTRPEAAARLAQMPVAILPVGSTEQHGPHLPLGTDIFLAEELAKRVSDATGAVVLPSLNFGYSWGWRDIPGTVTFSEKLMEEILIETARSVERYGVKVLVFLNGHEANTSAMKYAIRRVQDEVSVKLLGMFYPGIKEVYARQMESPTWGGMFHADEFETSLLLASDKKTWCRWTRRCGNTRPCRPSTAWTIPPSASSAPAASTVTPPWPAPKRARP